MSNGRLLMLKVFQDYAFEINLTLDDIKSWLIHENAYNTKNLEILKQWQKTQYKREYLTDKQIAEWYEFYFC